MSASAFFRNPIFLRGFDLKIKMCLTLLLRTKINIVHLFSEQHDRLYNSAAVTFYKLCLHIHESNISDPVMNASIFMNQIYQTPLWIPRELKNCCEYKENQIYGTPFWIQREPNTKGTNKGMNSWYWDGILRAIFILDLYRPLQKLFKMA